MFDVIIGILAGFFGLRAAGKKSGAVTAWGAGKWGFLRMLDMHGPKTVPQIARARSYSRQRMQKLADELADEGLVTFADNPDHKTSRLVTLTPKGQRDYDQLQSQIMSIAGQLAADMKEADLKVTAKTLDQLTKKLDVELGP